MARILTPGDVINDYTIEFEINRGNTAFAYGARASDGKQVFLKQFKSPSTLVPWYKAFVDYQEAMRSASSRRRSETFSAAFSTCSKRRYLRAIRSFATIRSSNSFLSAARISGRFLAALAANPYALKWERRIIWAKVIMGSIRQMHEFGIVHGDLKPPNLMLIADKAIKSATGSS